MVYVLLLLFIKLALQHDWLELGGSLIIIVADGRALEQLQDVDFQEKKALYRGCGLTH